MRVILYTKHEHNNTPKYIPSDYVIPLSIEAGAKAKTGLKIQQMVEYLLCHEGLEQWDSEQHRIWITQSNTTYCIVTCLQETS